MVHTHSFIYHGRYVTSVNVSVVKYHTLKKEWTVKLIVPCFRPSHCRVPNTWFLFWLVFGAALKCLIHSEQIRANIIKKTRGLWCFMLMAVSIKVLGCSKNSHFEFSLYFVPAVCFDVSEKRTAHILQPSEKKNLSTETYGNIRCESRRTSRKSTTFWTAIATQTRTLCVGYEYLICMNCEIISVKS